VVEIIFNEEERQVRKYLGRKAYGVKQSDHGAYGKVNKVFLSIYPDRDGISCISILTGRPNWERELIT
jgi:hypothetical protein